MKVITAGMPAKGYILRNETVVAVNWWARTHIYISTSEMLFINTII